jgi:hypothetical protein
MSNEIERRNQALGNFVAGPSLQEYAPRCAGHFMLARDRRPRQRGRDHDIMSRPRITRRLTHSLVSRNWQHRVVNDLRAAYTAQLLSITR